MTSDQRPTTISVSYDAALRAKGFTSPFVALTIAGQRALFMVDTGASVHTFAQWFVFAAALPAELTDARVTGSTGRASRVQKISSIAAALDDGRRLAMTEGIVAPFPPIFEELRIGGVVSPQLLAAEGEEAVLDLRAPSLTFRPAARRSANDARLEPSRSDACVTGESLFRNRLYAMVVRVDGVEAELLIDTGASRTTIGAQSAAGLKLAGRSHPAGANQGVGGALENVRRVPSIRVDRGGSTAVIDVQLGAAPNNCGADGLLGMDALAGCTIVLGPSRSLVVCR